MYKNNLYYIRIERGQTQKEFAEELGMNPNVYSRYERGETNMSLEVAKGIAQYCDISLDYLAGLEELDYPAIGEGQAELEERIRERRIEDDVLDEYISELEKKISDFNDNKDNFKAEIKETIESLVKRVEAIEKKIGSTQTDNESNE